MDSLPLADSAWFVVAWTQLSGLEPLAPAMNDLRARGGAAEAIVGIDGGIATREALDRAVELFDPIHVFHDPSMRTFHPKLYVLESAADVLVVVGSSNLTGGGLFLNYEANVSMRLKRGDTTDDRLIEQVKGYRATLLDGSLPSRSLDKALVAELADESTLLTSAASRRTAEETRRAKATATAKRFFQSPVGLPGTPSGVARGGRKTSGPDSGGRRRSSRAVPPSTAAPAWNMRWWKQLTMSDAIRKPATSHQRKFVVLGKAQRKDIDQKIWFRYEFFDAVTWTTETMRGGGNVKEIALIPMEVFEETRYLGRFDVRFEHAPNRIADQNNAPTYMHWSSLESVIRAKDYTDWWIALERLRDGTFRLTLTQSEPTNP